MTDRELLVLAAKAAGMNMANLRWYGTPVPRFHYLHDGEPTMHTWNPLIDDGDALRLALKLRIDIDFDVTDETRVMWFDSDINLHTLEQMHDGDPYATTRRAIVLAAAEIGKAMP